MQVLKEEVRNNILKAAIGEFRENGFKNSSMRNIAKRSGMTVGNLYRYFDNKEDLFYTIVNPTFNKMKEVINDEEISLHGKDGKNYIAQQVTKRIIEINEEYRDELLIIINGSEGTKFASAKKEFLELVERRIKGLLDKIEKIGLSIDSDFISKIIATTYVEGVLLILNTFEDSDRINEEIELYAKFTFKDIVNRFK
ncbi:TetR/AcrR family transcriptional regulator [Wukongibacter baidiensis]|uniref:TetR/AcrR family transcriptional regulator n=1 Tax=Wukongibacter baidiensis TaxID=1723361 RepID=UPI003D7FF773